ncbi:hypothetical protein LG325_12190 [Marinobacter nauticus]
MDEPFRIYYRVCLIASCLLFFPLSLILLSYRVYRVFWQKEPAIYPDCNNWGLKIGKFFLVLSKILVCLYPVALVITMLMADGSGSVSGVPAALILAMGLLLMPLVVGLIEISQINHRKFIHQERKG